jgi:hypothetical protein
VVTPNQLTPFNAVSFTYTALRRSGVLRVPTQVIEEILQPRWNIRRYHTITRLAPEAIQKVDTKEQRGDDIVVAVCTIYTKHAAGTNISAISMRMARLLYNQPSTLQLTLA